MGPHWAKWVATRVATHANPEMKEIGMKEKYTYQQDRIDRTGRNAV